MACGDISGNVAGLQRLLKQIKYPGVVDEIGLRLGDPLAALPLLHYALLKYSRHVCAKTVECGVQLHGKTDQRFVEHAFRLARDHLGVRTALTPAHFFSQARPRRAGAEGESSRPAAAAGQGGYAELKVLLLRDVISAAKAVHLEGVKRERASQQRGAGAGAGADARQSPSCGARATLPGGVWVERGQPVPGAAEQQQAEDTGVLEADVYWAGPSEQQQQQQQDEEQQHVLRGLDSPGQPRTARPAPVPAQRKAIGATAPAFGSPQPGRGGMGAQPLASPAGEDAAPTWLQAQQAPALSLAAAAAAAAGGQPGAAAGAACAALQGGRPHSGDAQAAALEAGALSMRQLMLRPVSRQQPRPPSRQLPQEPAPPQASAWRLHLEEAQQLAGAGGIVLPGGGASQAGGLAWQQQQQLDEPEQQQWAPLPPPPPPLPLQQQQQPREQQHAETQRPHERERGAEGARHGLGGAADLQVWDGGAAAAEGRGLAQARGGAPAQVPPQLRGLMQALVARLDGAEAELEVHRSAARQAQEAMQARITLLEGRLRFVENQLAAGGAAQASRLPASPPLLAGGRQQPPALAAPPLPPRPLSRLDALLDDGSYGAAAAEAHAGWAAASGAAAATTPAKLGGVPSGARHAPSPGVSAGAPSPGSPWGGPGARGAPPAAAGGEAPGAAAFGGALGASARDPWHQQEVEDALRHRGGHGLGARKPQGQGAAGWEPRPQSTQVLVDKLAARHAEAQALLQKMQARRSAAALG